MKIEEIIKNTQELFLDDVKKVISGEKDKTEGYPLCPQDAIDCLEKKLGFKDLDEFDSNGWQYDYWIEVEFGEKEYIISGSGYYGNLHLYDED